LSVASDKNADQVSRHMAKKDVRKLDKEIDEIQSGERLTSGLQSQSAEQRQESAPAAASAFSDKQSILDAFRSGAITREQAVQEANRLGL